MGNCLNNHDVLGVIYRHSKNYKCMLVSKEFYRIILKNGKKCNTCNKIVKIFNNDEWITHEDDSVCHGYYRDLEYYKMIRRMIQLSPNFFGKIERQCYALNMYAININPSLIKYVKDQRPKLCEMATNKNINTIQYIHNPSDELCLNAIHKNIFKFIKEPSEKICLEAVKFNGMNLEYVHDDLKTNEICLEAVKNSGQSLQFINEGIQTQFLCDIAIKNDYNAIKYVDAQYQSYEMCMYVIGMNPNLINYIVNPREQYYVKIFNMNPINFNGILTPPNIAIGPHDFNLGGGNACFGFNSGLNIVDGSNNICVGKNSGINILKNDNVMIGNDGRINDDGVIRIGTNKKHIKNYQGGIFSSIIDAKNACPVFISPSGQLGTILK